MSIKAYKGFNKDMTCRGFQFKEGETYHEDEAKLCEKGFHACLDPLDCFNYYDPAHSVYHEVELDDVANEKTNDSKICGKTLKVGAALDVAGIVKAHLNVVKNEINNATEKQGAGNSSKIGAGDFSNIGAGNSSKIGAGNSSNIGAGNSSNIGAGNFSKIGAGDFSKIGAGDFSNIGAGNFSKIGAGNSSKIGAGNSSNIGAGKNSIIAAFNSKAKAGLNSLIALANREWNGNEYIITDYAAAIVDGKTIKPDTWYKLKDGKFVEVKDSEE